MTVDKLIEELELMKERGIDGGTDVFLYADDSGYYRVSTFRIDGVGDLIIEGE